MSENVPSVPTETTDPVTIENKPESNCCKITISMCIIIYMNLLQYIYRFSALGVMESLKKYFTMDEKAIGLMQTTYLCGTILLTPLCGYLGDRYSRKWILIVSMTIWVIGIGSTLLCKPEHYILFLALRTLVAIGDGVYGVIAPILISDMFPIDKRSTYIMIFCFTIPIGSGMGLICGGQLYKLTGSWQAAAWMSGALGLLGIILMVIFMFEPKRGAFENANQHANTDSFWQDIMYLVKMFGF